MTRLIVSRPISRAVELGQALSMSRTLIPPAYMPRIFSSSPPAALALRPRAAARTSAPVARLCSRRPHQARSVSSSGSTRCGGYLSRPAAPAPLVPQMLGQLGLQRRLDHAARELGDQAAWARDLLGREAFERVRELLTGQKAGKPVDDLLRCIRHRREYPPEAFFVCVLMGVLSRPPTGWESPLRPTGFAAIPSRNARPNSFYPDPTQNIGQNLG